MYIHKCVCACDVTCVKSRSHSNVLSWGIAWMSWIHCLVHLFQSHSMEHAPWVSSHTHAPSSRRAPATPLKSLRPKSTCGWVEGSKTDGGGCVVDISYSRWIEDTVQTNQTNLYWGPVPSFPTEQRGMTCISVLVQCPAGCLPWKNSVIKCFRMHLGSREKQGLDLSCCSFVGFHSTLWQGRRGGKKLSPETL